MNTTTREKMSMSFPMSSRQTRKVCVIIFHRSAFFTSFFHARRLFFPFTSFLLAVFDVNCFIISWKKRLKKSFTLNLDHKQRLVGSRNWDVNLHRRNCWKQKKLVKGRGRGVWRVLWSAAPLYPKVKLARFWNKNKSKVEFF